jgi:hypothetical protein
MFEQMLAAATTTSETGAVGAATRPLDGRALTHGVDVRAGEGAGSSAIFFHRAPWVPFLLCCSRFQPVLVEVFEREREKKAGDKGKRGLPRYLAGPGSAAHRRRHGRRPWGRGRQTAAGPCAVLRVGGVKK